VSPFANRPESLFFGRIFPILGFVFVVGYFSLGSLNSTSAMPTRDGSLTVSTSIWQAAWNHYSETWFAWSRAPNSCRGDAAVNDYQREQCAKYWGQVSTMTAWASAPLILVLLFFFLIRGHFRVFYRRVDRRFREGKAVAAAKVLRSGSWDWFGYFFCLRSVRVELGQGRDVRVYVPRDLPALIPGQKVALFYGGKVFGARRYVGLLYAPHIAVMAGSRN